MLKHLKQNLLFVCIITASCAFSQLTNTGAQINVPADVYLNAQCDIINENVGTTNGIINNEGVIITSGHINNEGEFLGLPQSYVRLNGAAQNLLGTNTFTFGSLVIEGTDDKQLQIGATISDTLLFVSNNILIGNNDLRLLQNALTFGANNSRFVVTDGIGSLISHSMPTATDFDFPVGDNVNSYKPVIINYTGVVDTFAVRVVDGVTPADPTSVQKTYIIKESNLGTSTADIRLAWNSPSHGTAFDSNQALMYQQQAGVFTLLPGTPGASNNAPITAWFYEASGVQFMSVEADSFIVKSAEPPTITQHPQPDAICEYESATFEVSATAINVMSYQWQVNCDGTWVDLADGGTEPHVSGANDSILLLSNVPYPMDGCQFRCIVSTIAGSTTSDPATLTVYPAPQAIILGDTSICEGETAELTAYLGTSYLWSTGDTTQTIFVSPHITTDYSVTITNDYSCTSEATITVDVTPEFFVYLTSDYEPDHDIIKGQVITFTASPETYDNYDFYVDTSLVQSGGFYIYTTSDVENDQIVTVVASVGHCTASDSIKVRVRPVANAFTPFDKDGRNDIFAKGVHLIIFNRWGQLLYEGVEGWDGTYNGQRVSPGTYYYVMTLNKGEDTELKLTGHVALISLND